MATCVAVPVLAALSVAQIAAQAACEGWTTDEFWRTADTTLVKECLRAGYPIHDRFPLGNWTALHQAAAFSGDPEVVAMLIEAGADVDDSSNPALRTPLHVAARYNSDPEITRMLLRYGADVYAMNGVRRTPLHLAALFNENPAVVEALARVTAVNIKQKNGLTPLHDAARRMPDRLPNGGDPSPAVVEVLLRHGADLSAEALVGGTPLQWAENEAIVDLIRSETRRRTGVRDRFLRLVGSRVAVGAVALALLGSLVGRVANRSRTILSPSTHAHL